MIVVIQEPCKALEPT